MQINQEFIKQKMGLIIASLIVILSLTFFSLPILNKLLGADDLSVFENALPYIIFVEITT